MAKSNVVPFRRRRNSSGKHGQKRKQRISPRSGRSGLRKPLPAILWVIIVAVGGWFAYGGANRLSGLATLERTPTPDSLSASFSFCGSDRHVNCVVDGDTFWFQGEKIRIADIDTPELSPARCEAERIKGEAAKARLLALLNSGTFSLSVGLRDEDKYGRKLRTVMRSGRSLGDTLIDENLARGWDGGRHPWCN